MKAQRSAACPACADTGHVCENHDDRPWGGISDDEYACECGAGMPCPQCCTPVPEFAGFSVHENFIPRRAKH